MDYVVGFAFSFTKQEILLVKKDHPEWQNGLFNGIGGKVERFETYDEAMNRECKEETYLDLKWKSRGVMRGTNNDKKYFTCAIYSTFTDKIFQYHQCESEKLYILKVKDIDYSKCVKNLSFIIPYLLCEDHSTSIYITY